MLKQIVIFLFAALVAGLPVRAPEAAELVMVEEMGCIYCERWDAEISEIYPKTPEGQAAPLVRVLKGSSGLDAFVLNRPVIFTPTFILVEDGRELARIEGYPGEDFFWGLLGMILERHTGFKAAS